MKLFTGLFYFLVLTITFSALSGCGGTARVPNNGAPNTAKANTADPSQGESTYPPLPVAIANADLELTDGKIFKLSDRKGTMMLVNLWGIWCGPCRGEMPHLVEMQEKYKDKGFQVIGLNVGDEDFAPEDPANMIAFGTKMGLNYELARVDFETRRAILRMANFDGIPVSFLVSRDGRLRAVLRGGGQQAIAEMKKTVDRAMAE
jgi:thiol-disulfide isomerase/thioredoxin